MEEDSSEYIRTSEDVSSMINYAKLDENKLTGITQALYYPIDDSNNGNDDIKLIELNPHILSQIREGQTLYFKGGLNEKIVLCTDNKTYDVKEAEISNSLLLVPDLKLAQATSKSPLKSPKSNLNNRSLDTSNEDTEMDQEQLICRELEQRHVVKICHEYFECREINPRFRKLSELLQLTRYSGPENEYCIDKNLLFTFDQLLATIQCSRHEFLAGLRQYRAFEIAGRIRVLEYEYEYRTISLMLGLINENTWKLNEIDKTDTLEALNGIAPEVIVNGLFDLYTEPCENSKYKYYEDLVCRIIAQNILRQGLKFHINDFITTWQEALPDGMKIDEKYLRGIGLVDRESSVPCIRSLIETNLPVNLMERLRILFSTKEKWTLDQIEPYIEYFTTPQLSITSILAKHARSMTVAGQRIYVSKHGL